MAKNLVFRWPKGFIFRLLGANWNFICDFDFVFKSLECGPRADRWSEINPYKWPKIRLGRHAHRPRRIHVA